nr:TonB-dependent receptor [Pedobacter sp. SYSU D00535]
MIFFGLITLEIFGQATGKIAGKVTDQKTGEALIGVTVKVKELAKGIATDVEGRYLLSGLATGTYTLQFSYIGFPTKNVSDVAVKSGTVTNLDVVMEESEGTQLQQVVINVSARQESISGLYAQQKNAVSVSSGIVAEQIRRSPDRNTSEVLRRVSGASIQDGKFVIVRGLSDRYNTALINNAILPSSEPDRKAFSFDIIPSNLIDRIVINKTASPDLPGDFSGGLTQVFTKDVPDRNYLGIAITSGYNTQSTFNDFRSNGRNSRDFLGFDDGTRSIPEGFPTSRREYNGLSEGQRAQYSRLFQNPYGVQTSVAKPVQSYQLNLGNVKRLKNDGTFGSIVSLSYRNSQNIQNASRETFDGLDTYYSYNDDLYRYSTTWGVLGNFSYKNDRTKISLKNLYNQTFDDNYIDRSGFNQNNNNIIYSGSDLTQKSLLNSQLEGEHRLGSKNLRLEWNLNYSLLKREQPDLRNIMYGINSEGQRSLVDSYTRRLFSDLDENILGGSTAFTMPFQFLGNKSSFKAGFMKQMRTREFSSRTFLYTPASGQTDPEKRSLPMETIFNPENISVDGFILDEITNNSDSYDALTDLNAAYVMLDNQLSEKLRLVWGVRAESYYQNVDALLNAGSYVDGEQTFFNLLPSFNMSYALNDKANLRLSGSKTVSRPELRELAPFAFYNQEENTQITGNPNLKLSDNTNLDLRYELYPNAGEALTASAFYKNFQNPIEQVVGGGGNYGNLPFGYANAKSAYSYGVEFEVRKRMSFLAAALENFTASANVTFIKSQVDIGQAGQAKRSLQGQSPYLLNAGLQYAAPKSQIIVNALYNRIGSRIWRVGNSTAGIPDFYENGRDVLDLQFAKRILRNRAELRLNVGDVFNQSQVFYQNFGSGNKKYNANDDIEFFKYKSGTTFTLGLTYDFSFAN